MWHVETDYFALAILAVLVYKNRRFIGGDTKRNTAFLVLLVLGILSTVIDILASLAMNGSGGWWYYQMSMSLYAGTQTVPTVAWIAYMATVVFDEDWPRAHTFIVCAVVPCIVVLALALTNVFNGWFFMLSPDMVYSRGPLFLPLGFGLYGIYMLIGLVVIFTNRKNIVPRTDIFLMISFFAISLAAILIQLAHPGWLLLSASYACACALCDATMEERNRKRLYQEIQLKNESLTEAMARAEEANAAKEGFFSRVSHDMRTPMNGILGLADLALEEDDVSSIKKDVAKIRMSGQYMLGLINDTLDIQRADADNLKLEPRLVDGGALTENIADMVRLTAEAKGVRFVVENVNVSPDFKTYVDPVRLKQVFLNLLNNAVKFTPAGGSVIFRIERMSAEGSIGRFRFSVIDTGVGMSSEFMENNLFKPFAQERNEMSGQYAGSGLGLSIVKRLVDQMGGRIEVESERGEGTVFRVSLALEDAGDREPIASQAAADDARVSAEAAGTTDAYQVPAGTRVLLCEDNALNAEIASRLLAKRGYEVVIAEDGKNGLEEFSDSPVDEYAAILMDIRMPVMDGYDATRAIRKLDRSDAHRVPIIAMTADAFDESVREAMAAGMNAHLPKPVDPQLLYRTLAEQIAAKAK